jgi:hypothetical protein
MLQPPLRRIEPDPCGIRHPGHFGESTGGRRRRFDRVSFPAVSRLSSRRLDVDAGANGRPWHRSHQWVSWRWPPLLRVAFRHRQSFTRHRSSQNRLVRPSAGWTIARPQCWHWSGTMYLGSCRSSSGTPAASRAAAMRRRPSRGRRGLAELDDTSGQVPAAWCSARTRAMSARAERGSNPSGTWWPPPRP